MARATAYTGNGPYCYSNSLHMCLTQAGMPAVPPVSLLECMTGMPFGRLAEIESRFAAAL